MTPEELLKPRYKVIADYPNNTNYHVGSILDRDWARYPNDDETQPAIWRISQYPHLFKKLEWWEERDLREMPKYLKTHAGNSIRKISEYMLWGNGKVVFEGGAVRSLKHWIPATEEEFKTMN